AGVVTTEDVDWLVGRLQAMVTARPVVWAGRGMTLLQLIALHFISALAPATPTELGPGPRLMAVLHAMSIQTRRPLIDILIDTVRRSAK
ncbi:MAG: hypothetical protein ACRDRO_02640, partial [Pseudonocardiaceae bacterium]